MKKIFLKKIYRTPIEEDYSDSFLEGVIEYKDDKEKKMIVDNFLNKRTIKLYENIGKYIDNTISNTETVLSFSAETYLKTSTGFKTIKGNNFEDYQDFYWLENEKGKIIK